MVQDVPFEADRSGPTEGGDDRLCVDVDGFEGPLDLLLDLARRQKVDLHEISILALAEQYLAFVETARAARLELAADFLVMAAWLAYLKSRLLLPEPEKPEVASAGQLATALAARLRRLEAIRQAARRLEERPQLGREVFGRAAPDRPPDARPSRFKDTLFDLLSAYARQRQRGIEVRMTVARREVWSLAEARTALEGLVGQGGDWIALDALLLRYRSGDATRTSMLASALSAALEMVREGKASLRQEGAFAPLELRRSEPALRFVPS